MALPNLFFTCVLSIFVLLEASHSSDENPRVTDVIILDHNADIINKEPYVGKRDENSGIDVIILDDNVDIVNNQEPYVGKKDSKSVSSIFSVLSGFLSGSERHDEDFDNISDISDEADNISDLFD